MPAPQNYILDGFNTLEKGMNSGFSPQLIGRNQFAFGVNTTVRGSFIGPRPPFIKRKLTFPSGAIQTNFEDGKYQGKGYYTLDGGIPQLVIQISGRTFMVDVLNDFTVRDFSIPTDLNDANGDQAWIQQVEKYCVIQNGIQRPLLYSPGSMVRSDCTGLNGPKQVPIGTCMGYGLGRLAVALQSPNDRHYVLGDLLNITFTENDIINEGGDFVTLGQTGPITAFAYPVNLNTALGQSNLTVFTPKGVYYNVVPIDRTQWKNLNSPLQVLGLKGRGSLSPDVTNVNSDLWFRSKAGEDSLGMAVRNFGDWGDTPMSLEMNEVLKYDTESLLKFNSNCEFDNRRLSTCSPMRTYVNGVDRGVVHRGLTALDFFLLGSMTGKQPPAWDGLWTGPRIYGIIEGDFDDVSRCFVIALDLNNKIAIYELMKDGIADHDDNTDVDTPITWWFDTSKFNFQAPKQFKQLVGGDAWIFNLQGSVAVRVDYRHDFDPVWHLWHAWTDCGTITMCPPATGCISTNPPQPQFRYFQELPQPSDDCDTVAGYLNRAGWEFQQRITVQGYMQLTSLRLKAAPIGEPVKQVCTSTQPCKTLLACASDIFAYQI